jgi:hypothetical protein
MPGVQRLQEGSIPHDSSGSGLWEGPLFVIGMPRSGTKLLRGLLDQNPRIRIPPYETDFLPLIARWVRDHGPPHTPAQFGALAAEVCRAPYFVFRKREGRVFSWQPWRNACAGRFDAADLFEGFIRSETGTARGSGVIWGDKSPSYIEHIDLILQVYPHARIVHLVRDVRDYCVSIRNAWGKDVRRAAFRWSNAVANAHERCMQAPQCLCEVHYEALLAAPEREMSRLCEFVGVLFTPDMLKTNRPVENLGAAVGRRDIKTDNAGKYAAVLTPRELEAIEALAWQGMHAVGYRPVRAIKPQTISRATLAALRLKDALALTLSGARQRGFIRALRFFAGHQHVSRG